MARIAEVNVVHTTLLGQTYVFLYTDEYRKEAVRRIIALTRDPEHDFGWIDAIAVCAAIKRLESERAHA